MKQRLTVNVLLLQVVERNVDPETSLLTYLRRKRRLLHPALITFV